MKWKYTKKWIKDNGYHGLVNSDAQCGCHLGNFHQCTDFDSDNTDHDCEPAYKTKCHQCGKDCSSDDDYCMTADRSSAFVRQLEMAFGRWTADDEKQYQIAKYNKSKEGK